MDLARELTGGARFTRNHALFFQLLVSLDAAHPGPDCTVSLELDDAGELDEWGACCELVCCPVGLKLVNLDRKPPLLSSLSFAVGGILAIVAIGLLALYSAAICIW